MSLLPDLFPASLDDIVFEGRNQAYGAYQLRQLYTSHLRLALALMLGLCAILLLSGWAWQRLHPLAALVHTVSVAPDAVIPPTYVTEPPKPIVPPAEPSLPRRAAPSAPTATLPTHVVKDELAAAHRLPTPEGTELPTDIAALTSSTTNGTETALPGGSGPAAGGTEGAAGVGAAVTGPYVVVEKMPEFAGGAEALGRYLRSHLRYPSAALAAQAEGQVFVSFVVQADGTIAEVTILKGLGYGLDEEAQRVVQQMPAWAPGRQSNHAVPVRFTLPITFHIQ